MNLLNFDNWMTLLIFIYAHTLYTITENCILPGKQNQLSCTDNCYHTLPLAVLSDGVWLQVSCQGTPTYSCVTWRRPGIRREFHNAHFCLSYRQNRALPPPPPLSPSMTPASYSSLDKNRLSTNTLEYDAMHYGHVEFMNTIYESLGDQSLTETEV